ncbi:hypothetical protein SIN8267_00964 [Sinobacterium norvegicum]|uniref:Polyhydroxybutyrate depolymerase n=1 Tax=Sinobacterium norvegicum TaxID=1641715 RepID=A0ABM9ACD4_9GAMM|nr:PHB depolymerase family esterase [Sinobacterium norvegicum]CAH0990864.1 hypothetical protein SIN8267_00964 [Sinobacterium norvegicum]
MLKKFAALLTLIVSSVFIGYYVFLHVSLAPIPTLSGQFISATLKIDGNNRSFHYYLPADIDVDRPLIFALHGSKGDGEKMRQLTAYQFDHIADRDHIIAVYPDGYKHHWHDCRASASYAANVEDIDDIAFFNAMINYFSENHQIDRSRVFATGFSNGGHMVYRLALEMPEAFAALAPIAANLPIDDNLDCQQSSTPVSIAILNGTEDPINPYEGGLVVVAGDKSRGVVTSSTDSANYFRQLSGADKAALHRQIPERDGDSATRITLTHWQNDNNIQVRLYRLTGSGHVIPSTLIRYGRFYGGDAGDMDAPIELWQFFQSASKP